MEQNKKKEPKKRARKMIEKTYISFDWALKRLLRDKANFDVLEGFLTTLLNQEIKIVRLLESESNKDRDHAKSNRVDILAENQDGELLLIEVQGESEFAYFQRILFGASKLVTEYIERGNNYEHVKKVYSINIVYFDLGQGKDYVYHGKTEFRGIHYHDVLQLNHFQKQKFGVKEVSELYPEYYILKVNDFNRWSKVPLEQWLYFLSTSDIPEDADAPGLKAAREKLLFTQMSREDQIAFCRYIDDRVLISSQIYTAHGEGMLEGMEKGLEKGLKQGRKEGRAEGMHEKALSTAAQMKQDGLSPETIAKYTGLTVDEIEMV